jgi:hypothetical protein
MSDLDIVRQEHGLPVSTPLEILAGLAEDDNQLPLPVVSIDAEVDWGVWLEMTYDPDNGTVDRLEDLEVG